MTAVELKFFHFLQCIWVFKKNYLGDQMITFNQLFELTDNFMGVCEWMVITEDNLLVSLLYHNEDALAVKYMNDYTLD